MIANATQYFITHNARFFALLLCGSLLCAIQTAAAQSADFDPTTLSCNRQWDSLPGDPTLDPRTRFKKAAQLLGKREIRLAGLILNAEQLRQLAAIPANEPMTRGVREQLRRPIDVEDFLYFLDDVIHADKQGRLGKVVYVTSGRARGAGILLHPDDVFKNKPRRYGDRPSLRIDVPQVQDDLTPANNGDPLGPNWTVRYKNPSKEADIIHALRKAAPGFNKRVASLVRQLRKQGVAVWYSSSLRHRERGYLMYGAFALSRTGDDSETTAMIKHLDRINTDWKLHIPIRWQHPQGLAATREAARQMKETYGVVYATESGARNSLHYEGIAVDFNAVGLPRKLTLRAPNGKQQTFDLSGAEESRDLSLTPALIEWIEVNFDFYKLRTDYPHWTDMVALRKRNKLKQ
ncbi:MAG: hypothetical protein OEZ39_02540 [Gammaproteobacteria bacterium]|nr:hypothetical protein [Gammaproteobacteria bacterium]MDH5650733.1 hypothetical protein [Gammaproteobacteria bacterium]